MRVTRRAHENAVTRNYNALVVGGIQTRYQKPRDPLDIVANGLESPAKTERDSGQVPGAWARLARA